MATNTRVRLEDIEQKVLDEVMSLQRKDMFYYNLAEHMCLSNKGWFIKAIDFRLDIIEPDNEDMVVWINVEDLIDDMTEIEIELDEILPLN